MERSRVRGHPVDTRASRPTPVRSARETQAGAGGFHRSAISRNAELNCREDPGRRDPDALRHPRRARQPSAGRRACCGRLATPAPSWPSCPSCSTPATASAPTSALTARPPTGRRSPTSVSAAGSGRWRSPRGSSSATGGTSTTPWRSAPRTASSRSTASATWCSGSGSGSIPGATPLVVSTPWGRVGFAVCADMIYRKVWDDYRDRIDLAVVSAAWPDFADRRHGPEALAAGPRRAALGGDPREGGRRPGHPRGLRQPVRRDADHGSRCSAPRSTTGSPARAASATAATARPCGPSGSPRS